MLFSVLHEFNWMNVRMRKACEDIGKCLHIGHGCLNWGHDRILEAFRFHFSITR